MSFFGKTLKVRTLEINDNEENKDGSQKVHKVWQVLSVKSFVQSPDFIRFGC